MLKKLITITMMTALLVTGMLALASCKEKEPISRRVELELIDPTTGKEVINGSRMDLPKEKTYVEVRIKDKETGEYLTDEDLPQTTIKKSYHVNINVYTDGWGKDVRPVLSAQYWPEKVEALYDHYKISIFFDCYPEGLNDPYFYRKYTTTVKYVRVIFNRPEEENT